MYDSLVIKVASVFASFASFIFSVSAIGVYGNTCHNEILKVFPHENGYTVTLYSGFFIAVAACAILMIIFTFHLFTPVVVVETTKIFNLV